MTVSADDRRIAPVSLTAGQTEVTFDFKINADSELDVWYKTDATGVISQLTLTTHYTVTLDGAAPNTGKITLVTAAAEDDELVIEGDLGVSRSSDFSTGGDYFASTVNTAEDLQFWILQEHDRDIQRAARLNPIQADAFDPRLPEFTAANQIILSNSGVNGFSVGTYTTASVVLSDSAPTAVGTAAAGSSAAVSRADHSHALPDQISLNKGADVASAGALTLGSDGNYFDVTGTKAITSIAAVGVGTVIKIHFDDALTLTHHATDLVLPGGADITTAAGDEAEFVEYASGDWRCTNYQKADGTAVVVASISGQFLGRQVFTASGTYTKTSGTNTIVVTVVGGGGGGGATTSTSGHHGGGGGGTAIEEIDISGDDNVSVTVGAGGSGNSNAPGDDGGTSSFGAYCSATGGEGGEGQNGEPGAGGVGSGGDVNIAGGGGTAGRDVGGGEAGAGGCSTLGGGGRGIGSSGNTDGIAAGNYGGGGGGAAGTGHSGGAGAGGIVIVEEYS